MYSFHDGNLNFYDPQVTGTYNGNEITGIQSPKVQFHSHNYRIFIWIEAAPQLVAALKYIVVTRMCEHN